MHFNFLPGTGWACQPQKMEGLWGRGLSRPIHSCSWNVNRLSPKRKCYLALSWNLPIQLSLRPLLHFCTAAHGEICFAVIPFCLSEMFLPSFPALCIPSSPGKNSRPLKTRLQRAQCAEPWGNAQLQTQRCSPCRNCCICSAEPRSAPARGSLLPWSLSSLSATVTQHFSLHTP